MPDFGARSKLGFLFPSVSLNQACLSLVFQYEPAPEPQVGQRNLG